jgi:DNA polymerase I-like protein with 3'-5' exonuclease and polymerase domains
VDFYTAKGWQDAFHQSFLEIKPYWSKAIAKGKALGYAETLAGRRFGLEFWSGEDRWSTESSSINHPIQGSGADMKELAIRELATHYPEQLFWFDLHDGLHMLVPVDYPESKLLEARAMLDNIDYEKEWGVKLDVPLTWDVQVGERWSSLKEL